MATDDAVQVTAQLGDWLCTYVDRSSVYHIFSPEWEAFENDQWREYEGLEARRSTLHLDRLPWQDGLEKHRDSMSQLRDKSHSFLNNNEQLCSFCPLASFGTIYPGEAQSYMEMRQHEQDTESPVSSKGLAAAGGAATSASLYHAACFKTFLREFHPQAWEPYQCLSHLQAIKTLRYHAGSYALAQRLSFATISPSPPPQGGRGFPEVFLNEIQWAHKEGPTDNPRYLWDAEKMLTVDHTWGRWRCKDSPPVNVDSVKWKIPKNSRFDVQELPSKLQRLGTRYIWIDLFCIPQDGSPDADIEIARQASIFRGCQSSIAWLNDVNSWDGVKHGLRWLSLKLQRNNMRHYDSPKASVWQVTDDALTDVSQAADVAAELCQLHSIAHPDQETPSEERTIPKSDVADEPISWFSSLWTLQEAVLCPEITLCSADWTRLTDEWGYDISLQTLMIFLNECRELCLTEGPIEESFMNISRYRYKLTHHRNRQDWLRGMNNVLTIRSPAVVCANANTWEICQGGSVTMASVGCVFSSFNDESHKAPTKKTEATFDMAYEGRFKRTGSDNIIEFLDSVAGTDGLVFAVALFGDCHW
ncbi:hypothetical protein PG994_004978 [Apiospora phragmitis]|uniref:Heterokaryon incompatibility domain-containing protein n=1 Tax=Apiospora phragmitis TaxID=2905665 RepID=A0ABR1VS39_9PEZI